MKERPIIFNAEMVNAILSGRKTQTRQVIQSPAKTMQQHGTQVIDYRDPGDKWYGDHVFSMRSRSGTWQDYTRKEFLGLCPFGAVGDRLWLRENWWQAGSCYARYPEDDEYGWSGSRRVFFAADGNPPNEPNQDYPNGLGGGKFSAASPNRMWRKRPSIHMPRWASRITLEITGVRVERLQDISDIDSIAEGCSTAEMRSGDSVRDVYARLWSSINGEESWQANPWVWVIEFKRMEESHD